MRGHNIIDGRGAAGTFVNFDPAKFVHDLRLKPRRGRSEPAILRKRRQSTLRERRAEVAIDIGAYQLRPAKISASAAHGLHEGLRSPPRARKRRRKKRLKDKA